MTDLPPTQPGQPGDGQPARPTLEGTVLDGRYRLDGLIGRGGMAEVYRGTDQTLGRPIAVKVLSNTANADAVERHASEAQIGARLNHAGLVAVYDVSTDHDPPFLVMELVEGITLADALERGPLASVAVAEIGAQLMAALAVVHRAGVLHRDIKPSNVMVAEGDEPVVKLTDFGISRLMDSTRLTSTGLLVGTARYLSPEQAGGETVGPETDVYAAGLVLLECLTGVQAFPGTQIETLSARLHKQPDVPDSLGPGWATVLGAMTRREPAARPDADEASRALRTLAEGGVPTIAERPDDGTRPMGAAAAGAVAGGALGAAAGAAGAAAAAPTGQMAAPTQAMGATAAGPPTQVPAGPPTGTYGAPPAGPGGPGQDGGGNGKRNAAIVAAVLAVVAIVALGAWALTRDGRQDPADTPTTPTPTSEATTDEPTDEPTQDEPTETEPTETEPTETEPTETEPTETEPTETEPTETEPTETEPTETEPTETEPTETEQNSDEDEPGAARPGPGNDPGSNGGSGPGAGAGGRDSTEDEAQSWSGSGTS